ncbi:MAG: G1 family glutamic endopeptidase [Acidimicrobiales bacterium]
MQWYESTDSGASFNPISGATSATYSFSAESSENGYEFEATFTNNSGSATTGEATLSVISSSGSPPHINSQPQNELVAEGALASFTASASGSPTPTVQWYESTDSGASFNPISGATSATYSFSAVTVDNSYEFEATFTNSSGSATTNAATLSVAPAVIQTSNWSGYADTSATFNAVSATWTVPVVTCSGDTTSYSVQWIGIDGYSSSTVEQDGTEADCRSGSPSYDAWYEMYGDSNVNHGYQVELDPTAYPVAPGDTVSASVSVSAGTWTLLLTDRGSISGDSWNFRFQVGFSGAAQSSAEWIVERPDVCSPTCSLAPLSDFGAVTFADASITVGPIPESISAQSDTAIEMVSGGTVLALPSGLDSAGDSFTDRWQAS